MLEICHLNRILRVWVTYDDETIEEVIEGIGEGIFGAHRALLAFLEFAVVYS